MAVSYSRQDAIGVITLDRPPANSYDKGFLDELARFSAEDTGG